MPCARRVWIIAGSVVTGGGLVLGLAACSSTPATSTHQTAAGAMPADARGFPTSPAAAAPASSFLTTLTSCTAVLDPTGWNNGPLTVNQMVSVLTQFALTDGITNLPVGRPSATDVTILDDAQTEMANYSGNKLSDDAAQLSSDIQSYNPDGPVNTSYANAILRDITALDGDCPTGYQQGVEQANG